MASSIKKRAAVIGLIQNSVGPDMAKNFAKTAKMVERAAKNGAQIICLQELYNAPYFPQYSKIKDKDKYAEYIPGASTTMFSWLAEDYGVVIIVPVFEKSKNRTGRWEYYNSAAVIDHKGKLLDTYRKIHIPEDPGFYEKEYFQAGDRGYKIFKTKFATFAVLICYDQWYPEAAREVRLQGAEIIFYPTAIGDIVGYVPPEGHWQNAWETVMRGHAIANSIPVVAVNRTGKEGKTQFWGQSFIADAFGKVIKRASKIKEEVIVANLDLAMNKFIADGWGFMRNRRPDTYKTLASNKLVEKSKKLKNIRHYKDTKKALES